jgi:ABC-type dipeptide/oligopeptide/nickel transport system permease component
MSNQRLGARSRAPLTHRRRPRWWGLGVRSAADRDVAGAIYGLILATSVIAVSRQYNPDHAGVTAVTVIVTATVFWLAHVYAGVMALGVHGHHVPAPREVRGEVRRQWPLVQAGFLPTVILLLAPLGVVADRAAQTAAMISCLVELAITGLLVARASGMRGLAVVASGAIALSFGVVIVALKIAVH